MAPPGEIAFVALWSKDLGSQRRFFVDLMGYELQQESDDTVVVSGSGTTIVLQKAVGDVAHLDGQTHIGFFVDSVNDFARQLYFNPQIVGAEDIGATDGVLRRNATLMVRVNDWARYLSATGARILSLGADIGGGQRAIVVQTPGGQTFALVGP